MGTLDIVTALVHALGPDPVHSLTGGKFVEENFNHFFKPSNLNVLQT